MARLTDRMKLNSRRAVAVGMVLLALSPLTARAQGPPPEAATPAQPEVVVPITNSDLARIRQALESGPAIKIDDSQLRYYVQVLAKQRTFAEYVKGYDLRNGPTKGGNPMTHQKFLQMVTPREFYSSGGITAWEQLQFAFTNWLGQTMVKRAIEELQSAKTQSEVDEIRERIDRELALIRGGASK
jgi:hypothetical protein